MDHLLAGLANALRPVCCRRVANDVVAEIIYALALDPETFRAFTEAVEAARDEHTANMFEAANVEESINA